MDDIVKKALGKVARYKDPQNPKMDDWKWRPLKDVHAELEGLPEIPSHVEKFGAFMDETANRAVKQGLTPRDLIKAYAITRASIQRRQKSADSVRENGLMLPPTTAKMIRPEGAMGEWLHSPMGQRYLDAAERGQVDEEAVAHAQRVMSPFGLTTEASALPWAAQVLGPHYKQVGDMVARNLMGKSPTAEWQDFSKKNLHGIGVAKAGFIASLLGRGDMPTFDARQVKLQTGIQKTKEATPMTNKGGFGVIDRLAARQAAMNPKMDPGLEPYRQHLTHHAIWDKAENATTTHDDVMNAMRNAKDGGRIGYSTKGAVDLAAPATVSEPPLSEHPLYKALLETVHGGVNTQFVKQAIQNLPQTGFKRSGAGLMMRDPRLMTSPPVLSDIKNTPKSGYLNTPFQQMTADYGSKNNLMPSKIADIEKMQREGAFLRPLLGDKTPADTVLMGHNNVALTDPVSQVGGGDYGRSEFARANEGTGWRSRQGASKGMQRRISEFGDEFPQYGIHTLMGHKSADSSNMLLHSIIRMVPNLPIKSEHIAAFDDEMRKKFPHSDAYPLPWPGIMNTNEVHDFFYRQPSKIKGKKGAFTVALKARPGSDVSKFVQNLDSVRWQSTGFPNVASARFANTVPELFAEPQLSSGYMLTHLDPTRDLRANDEFLSHDTYTHGLPTRGYAGRFKALVPAAQLFADSLGGAKTATEIQQTLMTKFPAVKVTQKIVDMVKQAEEDRKSKYGFASGGTVPKKTKNMERAMSLTSLYALDHDRDAG